MDHFGNNYPSPTPTDSSKPTVNCLGFSFVSSSREISFVSSSREISSALSKE